MLKHLGRALLALSVPALVITACGGNDAAQPPVPTVAPDELVVDADGAFPVQVAGSAGEVVMESRPERIVSLSPTHTEILWAIGAGDQVVAIDNQSNYPPEALERPSDLSGFEPNLEAIVDFEPDLVVVGDDFTGLTGQLQPLGISVWSGGSAATLDDVYTQIEALGALTGNFAEAVVLVAEMQAEIAELVTSIEPFDPTLTYYHELDDTLYSVTSSTFIGEVYGLFGLENIADPAGDTTDYPQLSAEFIVESGPDIVFLGCTVWCGSSPETVAARPGWDAIPAVVNNRVIEMDDDLTSRWGPRVVDFVRAVADALASVQVSAG